VFAIFGLSLGGGEIFLILALVLLLFGARHLPRFGEGLRDGIDEFRKTAKQVGPAKFDNQTLVHAITLVLVAALGFTVLACLR
jgi:sec-independent protein translocase protein TatA